MGLAQELGDDYGEGLDPLFQQEYNKVKEEVIGGIKNRNLLAGETYEFDCWDVPRIIRSQVEHKLIDFLKGEGFRITYHEKFEQYWVHWGSQLVDKRSKFVKWFCGYRTL